MERWHLLDDGPASGAVNMARDEFLLARAGTPGTAPVLRFYSFDPPAVSIGRHQDPDEAVDRLSLARDGVDLVRRETGGRALLHDGELTYCVCAPLSCPSLGGGLVDAYRRIAEACGEALRSCGVDARISSARRERRSADAPPPCLSSVTRAELTAGGRKIVASAQRRTAGALLQHGSILLRPGSERITRYLRGEWGDLGDRVTNVSREAARAVGERELRDALVAAFERSFAARFEPLGLTDAEERLIAARSREKAAEARLRPIREEASP